LLFRSFLEKSSAKNSEPCSFLEKEPKNSEPCPIKSIFFWALLLKGQMALIAFDLDNTLGFFFHIGIWSDFFSAETIENSFNKRINPTLKISASLRKKLKQAEELYIQKLLKSPAVLKTVFRPNLGEMIHPLINNKKVRAVAIYSNTWNTFNPYLGKRLIEEIYKCPGLFTCLVDATHSLRQADWKETENGQPLKTFKVLKTIFTDLCKVKGSITPEHILFVDERPKKHRLQHEDGLTYLKPTIFDPKLSMPIREKIFMIGLEVLEETGLLEDHEYLSSDIFHCKKYSDTDKTVSIDNIYKLLELAEKKLRSEGLHGVKFKDDSKEIRECIEKFLETF